MSMMTICKIAVGVVIFFFLLFVYTLYRADKENERRSQENQDDQIYRDDVPRIYISQKVPSVFSIFDDDKGKK